MSNEYRINLRLTPEEKSTIKDKASKHCMSINQYVKYKLLELEESTESNCSEADVDKSGNYGAQDVGFFDKNSALFARIIISVYMHVRLLGLKHLNKEELEKIHAESEEEFKKLGISKEATCEAHKAVEDKA